jgi:hypothetical protein
MSPTHGSWAQESLEKRILIIRLGEKLRERLDHLEALAASAAQGRAIEKNTSCGHRPI